MSPAVLFLALAIAQQTPAPITEEQLPEEDAASRPQVYAFNPVKATHEVGTGDFYMKKKNYKAAANRYIEATRWNPQMAEAFRKLGEAEEKEDNSKEARNAFQKALELDPDSKAANEVKKHLARLGPA